MSKTLVHIKIKNHDRNIIIILDIFVFTRSQDVFIYVMHPAPVSQIARQKPIPLVHCALELQQADISVPLEEWG